MIFGVVEIEQPCRVSLDNSSGLDFIISLWIEYLVGFEVHSDDIRYKIILIVTIFSY